MYSVHTFTGTDAWIAEAINNFCEKTGSTVHTVTFNVRPNRPAEIAAVVMFETLPHVESGGKPDWIRNR